MARRNRMSVLKRQRERNKAEKAALKREERAQRELPPAEGGGQVASHEDLEGYGVPTGPADEPEEG